MNRTSPDSALERRLGPWGASALVVSNMLGVGVFASTGLMAAELGDPLSILLVWILGAGLALAGGFCYAELAVNLPRSGGEYVYLREAYGPAWAFAAGWLSLLAGFSAPIAAAATLAAEHFEHFVGLAPGLTPVWALLPVALFTAWNLGGLHQAGRLQTFLTFAVVALILAFSIAVGVSPQADWSRLTAASSTSNVRFTGVGIALIWVMFSLSGWNAVVYVAEEVKRPERNLPLAILAGASFTAALCLILNASFLAVLPVESMRGAPSVGALAAERVLGVGAGRLLNGLMALTMLASVSAMAATGPRVFYAMAQNGDFFRFASRVGSRHSPNLAVLAQGVAAAAMIFLPFDSLLSYIGFSLTACTSLTVIALFRLRRRPEWKPLHAPGLSPVLAPASFLVVSIVLALAGAAVRPTVSLLAVLAALAAGVMYQRAAQRL